VSLYCGYCGSVLPPASTYCLSCGRADRLHCHSCGQLLVVGTVVCERCDRGELVVRRPPNISSMPSASYEAPGTRTVIPVPPPAFGGPLRTMPVITETYQAGRFGVRAEVSRPPGDVGLLNELSSLVELLHRMANRCTQFVGSTEHTAAMRREMRNLAATIQEEIEARCGSNL
jgi:hypothetical protein